MIAQTAVQESMGSRQVPMQKRTVWIVLLERLTLMLVKVAKETVANVVVGNGVQL